MFATVRLHVVLRPKVASADAWCSPCRAEDATKVPVAAALSGARFAAYYSASASTLRNDPSISRSLRAASNIVPYCLPMNLVR